MTLKRWRMETIVRWNMYWYRRNGFVIFTQAGVVLFSVVAAQSLDVLDAALAATSAPINALVKDVLVTHQSMQVGAAYTSGLYAVKWATASDSELVFAAVTSSALAAQVKYADALLATVRADFCSLYEKKRGAPLRHARVTGVSGTCGDVDVDVLDYASSFDAIYNRVCYMDPPTSGYKPARGGATPVGDASPAVDGAATPSAHDDDDDDVDAAMVAKYEARQGRGGAKGGKKVKAKPVPAPAPSPGKGRTWDGTFKYDAAAAAALDKSASSPASAAPVARVAFTGASRMDATPEPEASMSAAVTSWLSRSALGEWVSTLTGGRVMTARDLEPVCKSLSEALIAKNVAGEVAVDVVASVARTCDGVRVAPGETIAEAVGDALKSAVSGILTPRSPIDVLSDIKAMRSGSGPYVVVFCGVNGVGKSTTLSKIAYHIKDAGCSVMLAACDSFRSGAVEQLARHASALDIPLFSAGYDRDPVLIARDAIAQARATGVQVVLVDTAGRMQNNGPLMQQLAKMVAVNKPNLVLFVGEALVGNDGVDQLMAFDRALVDYAVDATAPRRIDGIVLTKFDTIDDKVGAALSMVYRTRIPIAFLGTGQKYQDLRKLNVGAVVKALLS